jgi:cytochrome P450
LLALVGTHKTSPPNAFKILKEMPLHPLEFCEHPEQFLKDLTAKYGDVFAFETSHGRVHVFNHPDYVDVINRNNNMVRNAIMTPFLGYGMLSSEGKYWQNQRRRAQPAFHSQCLTGFVDLINAASSKVVRQWEAFAQGDNVIEDASKSIRLCTLEIIMQTLFSADISETAEKWDAASQGLMNGVSPAFCSSLNKIPKPSDINLSMGTQPYAEFLNGEIKGIIKERRKDSEPPRDLLTLLIHTRDGVTDDPLSDEQIRDEIATMLMAGHETLAVALGWAFCELAEQTELQAQIIAEIDTALKGATPRAEDLQNMPKLAAFLDETLRIYPSIPFIFRRTIVEDTIDGYAIPADGLVLTSPYLLHRHKDFWDQPEVFDIENFTPEKTKRQHPCAYVPFHSGRHVCIGKTFALMEGKLILAQLLQKFCIIGIVGSKPPISHGLTLQAASPISIKIRTR